MNKLINLNFIKSKVELYFFMLTLLLIVFRILTLNYGSLPWLDEIMFVDPAVHFLKYKSWTTFAWYGGTFGKPVCVYPPLYQFVLIPWFSVFGISFYSVRILNLLFFASASVLLFRILYSNKIIKDVRTMMIYLLLFWSSETIIWISSNGRVDSLNLFTSVLLIYSLTTYRFKAIYVIISAFLMIISGIQAVPIITLLSLIYVFFFVNSSSRMKYLLSYFTGLIIGFSFMCLFFYMNGNLMIFLSRTVSYSGTLRTIAMFFVQYFDSFKNLNFAKSANDHYSIFVAFISALKLSLLYPLLVLINLFLSIVLYRRKNNGSKRSLYLLLVVTLCLLIMILSGRFAIYYYWMISIPAVALLIYNIKEINTKFVSYSSLVLIFLFFVYSNFHYLNNSNSIRLEQIHKVSEKLQYSKGATAVVPFECYYDFINKMDSCYMIEQYPLRLLPQKIDYMIYSKEPKLENFDSFRDEKGKKGFQFEEIALSQNAIITLYKIK